MLPDGDRTFLAPYVPHECRITVYTICVQWGNIYNFPLSGMSVASSFPLAVGDILALGSLVHQVEVTRTKQASTLLLRLSDSQVYFLPFNSLRNETLVLSETTY